MGSYNVYLETSTDGLCMAHVPGLPGCFVRAESRDEALRHLPEAIKAHHAWLARHGEPAARSAPGERIEIHVAGENEGIGPMNPGDACALFPPDREPVEAGEMEDHLRLMGHARGDLLALVRHLPLALLDWQPYPEWFSIRRVLRHVGDAEEWYVSRLVRPERLPPEWEGDEDLPLFEFLEMERRTAVACLRQLTPEERGGVFYPTAWTRHPEEAWTLRKVLRRFLEHEREHTDQVRQVLDLYRRALLAFLAAEQAVLLELLLGLDEGTLTRERAVGERTAKDVLAYLAARDRLELEALAEEGEARPSDVVAPNNIDGGGEALEALLAPWRDRGLAEVLTELAAAHEAWLAWLADLPAEALFPRGALGGAVDAAAARSRRLQAHTARLAAWREGQAGAKARVPSATVLQAALAAARGELWAAAALVPAGEEDVRPVCGAWTLKDVLGHVADWDLFGAEGLRHMRAARPPGVEHITDIDAWNQAHVAARRGQAWAKVRDDFLRARQALVETLTGMDAAALACRFPFPWGQEGTPYQWVRVYVAHDREHAADLRTALPVPGLYSSP